MRSHSLALVCALGTAAMIGPSLAYAADAPQTAAPSAAELKALGDRYIGEKRYAEALDAYERSANLSPNPALLYNRGRALYFLGRFPEALALVDRFSTEAPADMRALVPGLGEFLAELRNKVSRLSVRSNVAGARIMLGDRQVGLTPLRAPVIVNAGEADLELVAEGHFPSRRHIKLPANGDATVDVTLYSRATGGMLTVKSTLDGVQVAIDERAIGIAPVEAVLRSGAHVVRVERDGYDARQTEVVLRDGERRSVELDPIARPPLTSRWWFWTAIGAAVVGGTVLTVALVTERKGDSGDGFSPNRAQVP